MAKYNKDFVGSSFDVYFTQHYENHEICSTQFLPPLASHTDLVDWSIKWNRKYHNYLHFYKIYRSVSFCVRPLLKPLYCFALVFVIDLVCLCTVPLLNLLCPIDVSTFKHNCAKIFPPNFFDQRSEYQNLIK